MNDIHEIDIKNNKNSRMYLFVNVSCSSCIDYGLEFLSEFYSNDLTIVFIGDGDTEKIINQMGLISNNLCCIYDESEKINSYEVGMGKYLFVHVDKGECVYSNTPGDNTLKDLKNYIYSNSN
jgi:hypothetical protein